ncbi:MAG: hypothetical protein CVU98_00280 [Firmicutes bacterium HGW-Firmicutes-3]|jgi:HD-GYP domain-containing protein (c-di-GMP phosphodiesterase class II)|nr:MAG: hypothetical protein CVU98_00280 [Firmicutes bacterium HGW-Firmicutes-3]
MRLVPINSLKNDSIVAKTIYNERGSVLLKSNIRLSENLIEKLRDNGIISVYIKDDYSLGEIQDVISPELRNKAVREVKHVFEMVQRDLHDQITELKKEKKSIKKRLTMMADQKYFDQISGVIDDMMEDIGKNKDAMVGLVDIKNMNGFLYQHAVQVTVLSLVVGIDMMMGRMNLKELAIGAMLHDIGLAMIDHNLWIYKDDFTEEEKNIYKSHVELGYEFIKENTMLTGASIIPILEHHETYNGEGYPMGRKGNKIHKNARIVSVANVYDKMTSGIDGTFIQPSEAIEYIMGNSGETGLFDIDIARRFVRRVVPYAVGSYVMLSSNEMAVVVGYNVNNPLRPILKVIEENKKLDDLKKIDLMAHENYKLTIIKTL